ncbi:uncharacterized protein CELE_H40L08.7 [Caenorhabditis elegans]|uniref:Uncharacterized protein n=1 Tax=Caenorhabditis elegans TaxID=6239 RepID=A0A1D3PCP8_CAEEL|nr:Uncharacterized protein CELE_H40L08.7 [Caenorhabditis elegans]SCN13889.1 Uncharacterized protein CELE_H40L08.7 [Caenorhabditis elegans]|eukprot:NP_001333562.1 Uncharacterized protein CELE_H40L08.7 [Caenorhabditis elegans]
MLISQQNELTSRLSSSSQINEITHFKPAILSFPADWISTSVICFGLCELSIRVATAAPF